MGLKEDIRSIGKMQELIRLGVVLVVLIPCFILIAGTIRFKSWSDSIEYDLLFGVPFLFVLLATLGAISTVGFKGLTSLTGIPALAFVAWRGRITFQKPDKMTKWIISGIVLSIVFMSVKVLTLVNFNTGNFLCSFHDDYSYIQQINLLESQRIETHFSELIRSAFYMGSEYKLYHLVEFYFVLLFKPFLGGNSFSWFNFFLKPFLNVLAVLCSVAFFFRGNGNRLSGYWSTLIVVVLFYTTLRFNLLDEMIRDLIPLKYWKAVFFQNYYFPSPLSYHVSYKIALAFIFVLPVFAVWRKEGKRFFDLISFSVLAFIVSVAYLPLCGLITGISLVDQFLPKRVSRGLLFASLILLPVSQFFLEQKTGLVGFVHFGYATFFSGFNLIFENYFWHLFYFSVLVVGFSTIKAPTRLFALLLLLFPFIYFSPGLLFKVYSSLILICIFFLVYKRHPIITNPFAHTFLPALAFLYFLFPLFPGIANLDQVFSNYLFPLICLGILDFLFSTNFRTPKAALVVIVLVILFVNGPAIVYDNSTPVHEERIPDRFFQEPVFSQKWVNILSISTYPIKPAIDQHQLGQGILNRMDNVAISMGGFDDIGPNELEIFQKTGFTQWLHRIPAYEEMILKKSSLEDFISKHKVKVVLVEKNPSLEQYRKRLLPVTATEYTEGKSGYRILVLK